LLEGAAFDDRAVKTMTTAFEDVLRELKLTNREDPITEVVARKIIELYTTGTHDADQLRDVALKDIRQAPPA
jgi:hypothetical protein